MIRHLYLDLEDTIIAPVMDGWPQTMTINEEKVKAFIAEYKPDYVHLFSFAIHNAWDLHTFKNFTRGQIERTFDIMLTFMPTVEDDIIPACCKVLGMHPDYVDFQEMTSFWGKQQAFRLYMQHTTARRGPRPKPPIDVVLLDDSVYNEYFQWPDVNVTGRILNVDQLKEPDAIAQS